MRRNVVSLNIIGRKVEVLNSNNPYLIGLKGRVIDETRNMIYIETEGGLKKVPKSVCLFRFFLDNNSYFDVDGKRLIGTIDRRIKR